MAKQGPPPQTPRLGPYLRARREALRLTLRGIEEASGVSNPYLSQLETGKISKPSPHILHKLATVYAVPYETLMELAGYISRAPAARDGEDEPIRAGSRIPASALRDLTPEEEDALLEYISYLRYKRTTG